MYNLKNSKLRFCSTSLYMYVFMVEIVQIFTANIPM